VCRSAFVESRAMMPRADRPDAFGMQAPAVGCGPDACSLSSFTSSPGRAGSARRAAVSCSIVDVQRAAHLQHHVVWSHSTSARSIVVRAARRSIITRRRSLASTCESRDREAPNRRRLIFNRERASVAAGTAGMAGGERCTGQCVHLRARPEIDRPIGLVRRQLQSAGGHRGRARANVFATVHRPSGAASR